jgi:hypothetical protein
MLHQRALSQCFGSGPCSPCANATVSVPTRYGSSPIDSSVRPQRGSRLRSALGARITTRPGQPDSDSRSAPRSLQAGNLLQQLRVPGRAQPFFLRKGRRRQRLFCPRPPQPPGPPSASPCSPSTWPEKTSPSRGIFGWSDIRDFLVQRQPAQQVGNALVVAKLGVAETDNPPAPLPSAPPSGLRTAKTTTANLQFCLEVNRLSSVFAAHTKRAKRPRASLPHPEADNPCQYSRKLTSTVIITGTGVLPSFIAGLNLYLRTASSAFSSSPMPSARTTRGFCGFPAHPQSAR